MTQTLDKPAVAPRLTVRQQTVNRNAEMARKAFADHGVELVLNDGVNRRWICKKPGTSMYRFDITTFPGTMIVTGDLGTLVVERTMDMLVWARNSVGDIQYFAEKVPSNIRTVEYSTEVVEEWFRDELRELKEEFDHRYIDRDEYRRRRDKIKEVRAGMYLDAMGSDEVYRATQELWGGSDPPNFRNWDNTFLWCRQCVIWLLAHVDEKGAVLATPPPEPAA